MEFNFLALLMASIVPLLVGAIWYHPALVGKIWMKELAFSNEDLKNGNMVKIFGLTLLFSLPLALMMQMLTVHQMGPLGMIGGPGFIEDAKPSFQAFMNDYGTNFRTFKHGALHGFMSGLLLSLSLVGIVSLFERRSWKYIFIHVGYWTITLTLMGGIVCGWV
jgi:hypothetical protein